MSDYTPKSRNTLPIIFDDRMHVNNLIPKIVNRVNDNTEDLANLYEETEALQEDVAGKIDAPAAAGTAGQVLTTDGTGGTAWATVVSGVNVVDITGSTVIQTGVANTFYICGTLTSLTFTTPVSGICGIRFVSGSTPTSLTVNGVSYWMNGFNPSSLEANKTYEINIFNGVGVVGC